MIARYKAKEYGLVKHNKSHAIVTHHIENADKEFIQNRAIYYKDIEDFAVLEDIFEIYFLVKYDTGLEQVESLWRIDLDKEYIQDRKVLLRFTKGILPDWKVEDKNVCMKYVDITSCEEIYVVRKYTQKDAQALEGIYEIKQRITGEELIQLHWKYQHSNL